MRRQLDEDELHRMEIIRSDRLITVKLASEILGMSLKKTFRFLQWSKCPIYLVAEEWQRKAGRPFKVFSRDLLEALNELDVVNNDAHRGILEKITGLRDRPRAKA